MAHRGAAQVILNIFRHSRTPGNYVILSGDVHYSFVYEVLIRHRNAEPQNLGRSPAAASRTNSHPDCWNGSTASTAGFIRRDRP